MEAFLPGGWLIYGAAFLAILVGAAVQGSTGLGFGMVAAPILAIIDPAFVPGPLLVLALLVSVMLALRERRDIDGRGLGLALAGRIPASFLAGLTMAMLPQESFALVFALMVLAAVGLSLAGWRLLPTAPNLLAAGAASGYMGTITSIGAPPMALVYQAMPGPLVRGTMGAYFVVGAFLSIVALAIFGRFGWHDLELSVTLVPALLLGFALSVPGARLVDQGRVRLAMLALSGASAVVLLAQQIF